MLEVTDVDSVTLTVVLAVAHSAVGSRNLRRAIDVVSCELSHVVRLNVKML